MSKHDWLSERILFGFMLIGGYFGLAGLCIWAIPQGPDGDETRQLLRDILLTIGPLLGMIVQAIWKSDKTDRQAANTAAILADKAPNLSGAASMTVSPTPVQADSAPAAAPVKRPSDDSFIIPEPK